VDKVDIIHYWAESSNQDWDAAQSLFTSGHYMHALFFSHLSTEKLLKAHWVKDNEEDFPPRVHNLDYLYNQTKLDLDTTLVQELSIITSWNIEGRYQDYRDRFYTVCTKEYAKTKMNIVNEIRSCLIGKLQ
jgi:HEPN domain-containing protein